MAQTVKGSIAESEFYVKNAVKGALQQPGNGFLSGIYGGSHQEQMARVNAYTIVATAKHAPNDGKPGLNAQEQKYLQDISNKTGANYKNLAECYVFGKSLSRYEDNYASEMAINYANSHPFYTNKSLLAANEQQAPLNVAALAESELRASASVASQSANSQSTGNSLS